MKPISSITVWLAVVIALLVVATPVSASIDPSIPEKVLYVGDSEIIECEDAKRTAIGDQVVADVVALSSKEVLVNAKTPGKTVLYVWDNSGRRLYRITVKPYEIDLTALCDRISKEINDSRITVRSVGSTIMLEGTVTREAESSRAGAVAQAIVETMVFQGTSTGSKKQEVKSVSRPEGESFVVEKVVADRETSVTAETGLRCPKVVNLIQIEKALDEVSVRTMEVAAAIRQGLNNPSLTVRALPGSVVLVEGKVGTPAEMERVNLLIKGWSKETTDDKGMNDLSDASREVVTIVNAVDLDSSVAGQIMVRAQVVDINKDALKESGVEWGDVVGGSVADQPFQIGQAGLGPVDLFGGGEIMRLNPIGARIRALEMQRKARVLSEPNLLVLDGREANMLVGGEIPIPVPQSGGTGVGAVITIDYKEFGVRLKIQPVIAGSNTIQLRVMPEVSSLDFTNALVINGFEIPALRTRRAESFVNIKDGQSLIIGGLLQNEAAKLVSKIPVLGDLPIIGELFKTRSFQNNESELVIIITPHIVRPTAHAQTPIQGQQ